MNTQRDELEEREELRSDEVLGEIWSRIDDWPLRFPDSRSVARRIQDYVERHYTQRPENLEAWMLVEAAYHTDCVTQEGHWQLLEWLGPED